MKVTGERYEIRGDIRRPLIHEARAALTLGGFVMPNVLEVKYSGSERCYMIHMAFGDAIHMFTVLGPCLSPDEKETIFRSLAVDARIPIAEEL